MTIFLYPQNYLGLQFVEEPTRGAEKCREKCQQPDQENILAVFASWSFDQKPTAKRGNFSIEKVVSITKKRL